MLIHCSAPLLRTSADLLAQEEDPLLAQEQKLLLAKEESYLLARGVAFRYSSFIVSFAS
jgi:hypothetical protein